MFALYQVHMTNEDSKKMFYLYKDEVTRDLYLYMGHVASPVKNFFSSSHMLTRSTDPERRDGMCC